MQSENDARAMYEGFRQAKLKNEKVFKDEIELLKKELERARYHILALFQACARDGKYDHGCQAEYEDAQDYLIEHKLVDREKCVRS